MTDPDPLADLVDEVYTELHALARRHMRHERPDHTLQPTALVNEVYLRMKDQRKTDWNDRGHFIRIASRQIRRILVDHARARKRLRRGGDLLRVTFNEGSAKGAATVDLLELDDALNRLETESPEARAIVELRFFGGLTEPEIGELLDLNERTVRRRWRFARTWLFRELDPDTTP